MSLASLIPVDPLNDNVQINVLLESLYSSIEDVLAKQDKELEAMRKKDELENKLAQEIKLNNELSNQLKKVSRKEQEMAKVCSSFESNLKIAENDRNRLDTARDMYHIAKELSGVRWDFTCSPDIAKGYVKSESRKVLQAFEVASPSEQALWSLLEMVHLPQGKENKQYHNAC